MARCENSPSFFHGVKHAYTSTIKKIYTCEVKPKECQGLIARLRDTTWGHKAAAPAANFLDLAVDSSIISSYSLHDVWLLLSGGGLRVL